MFLSFIRRFGNDQEPGFSKEFQSMYYQRKSQRVQRLEVTEVTGRCQAQWGLGQGQLEVTPHGTEEGQVMVRIISLHFSTSKLMATVALLVIYVKSRVVKFLVYYYHIYILEFFCNGKKKPTQWELVFKYSISYKNCIIKNVNWHKMSCIFSLSERNNL